MPEGDTVLRTARRLHAVFAGERLTRAELRWGSLDDEPLQGACTLEVAARGKHILHRFDSGITLHSHLRMEGRWEVKAPDDAPKSGTQMSRDTPVRAILATAQWVAVGYRLGMLDLVATAHEHTLVGHMGPDILGGDWNEDVAVANLTRSSKTVGAALLDDRILAGIGTLYSSESLFLERIHPWLPAASMTEDELRRVVRRAQRLLLANLDHAVQSTTGVRRSGHSTYVHARVGHPCRRCGDTIRVASIGTAPFTRPMFYCPHCQGGLAPHDDGSGQAPLGASKRRHLPPRRGSYGR